MSDVESTRGPRSARSQLISPVLVGRAAELDTLRTAVAGPPSVAVISGEAGIGKSRLIRELIDYRTPSGGTVLAGRGYPIHEPFPLGAVLDAVSSLGDTVGVLDLSPLAGTLRPLLPELAGHLPAPLSPLTDPAAQRHRLFRALAELVERIGDAVLVLEDLHWADGQTIDFLGFLLSNQPPKLATVLSYRDDDAPDAVRALLARVQSSTPVWRIALRPLEIRQTGELTAAILDTPHVTDELAAHLRERTGGVPYAVEEVLAVLQERGGISRHGHRWARRELAALTVPDAIRDAVLERFYRLLADGRTIVEVAAVLQVPATEGMLRATSALSGDAATAALTAAVTSGLLEEQAGRLGFRHVLAAQAVEQALPGPHRRALHARAADALAQQAQPPLGRLANHLRCAGQLEQWAGCAEQAADQASALGHDAGAASMLKDVLTDAPLGPGQRVRVARKLAHAALYGVTHLDALTPLRDVLARESMSRIDRGQLRCDVAQLLAQAGDELAAYEQFEAAVTDLDGHPAAQARAMAALAMLNVPGRQVDRLAWANRALAALATTHDPYAETVVRGNRMVTLLSAGDPTWREELPALQQEPFSVPHRRLLARVSHNLGITACFMGHHTDAARLLHDASQHLRRCGNELSEHALRAAEVVLQFKLGQWSGLDDAVDALAAELIELPVHRIDIEWVAGCLRMARGDLDGARHRLETAWDLRTGLTAVEGAAGVAASLIRLHLARNDVSAAWAHARECAAIASATGLWVPSAASLPWAADALVAAGDRGAAHELSERLATDMADRDAPLGAAALRMSRASVASAAGHFQAAAEATLDAAEIYRTMPCPYEAALADERAAVHLRHLDDERAPATILAALQAFESLGASWDAARAARTARGWGLTLPTPYRGGRRGYGSQLSPRERAVARLASEGLSNSEIGGQLFLSTRTVEKHVSRALHKLGAASRRDLRHLRADLGDRPDEPPHPKMGS